MWLRHQLQLLKCARNEWKRLCRLVSRSASCGKSYYHNPGLEPLHYLTLGQLTSQAAQRWPGTDAFVCVRTSKRVTFAEADQQATKLAAGLLDLGLEPGDRIGICSPNSTQWFLTALAVAKAGLILVCLNPSYTSQELQYCLQKVGVRALVTDVHHQTTDYYRMLCNFVPGMDALPVDTKITCKTLPNFSLVIVNSEKSLPGTFRLNDLFDRYISSKKLDHVERRLQPDDCAVIQFTSGTTGKPKAVPQSHFNLINNSYFVGKRLGLGKKQHKMLAQSPLFHALGFTVGLLPCLSFGTTTVLPSAAFSVPHSCTAISKEQCTVLIGTPTMYVDLCSHVSSLPPEEQSQHQSPELAITGGALCAPELFRQMKNTFSCDRIVSVYGQTETTAIVSMAEPNDSETLMTTTVGRVSEHVEARVVDSDGMTVPLGTPGELWIRSYNNMAGYWEDPKSTSIAMTSDRWLKTGDKYILLENGYGKIVGRIKDMIIRGGENISPKEVEEFLITHPDIMDAQVYGVPNERLGEEVACSLRMRTGCNITQQEIKEFCKDKITYFKIPKYVEVLEDFPKTASGKIQKFKLREAMEKKIGINKQ